MAIWIPKSLLRESNVEQQLKLTFKLPKNSTSSSSESILPFRVSKPQPLLFIHHIPSHIPLFIFPPFSCHHSRCVLTFKLPKNSTSSSSKRILPFHVPKPQPLLSTHHILSRIRSFTFYPSTSHTSRCVLILIFPSFPSSNLSKFA